MSTEEVIKLVRENERMKSALLAIQSKCENASFGSWRQPVYDLTRQGLGTYGTGK